MEYSYPNDDPESGRLNGGRKFLLACDIIVIVILVIYLILVIIMKVRNFGLFSPYKRPPLPGQTSLQTLGDPTNGNTNPTMHFTPGEGVVVQLGQSVPLTDAQKSTIAAAATKEINQWNDIFADEAANQKGGNTTLGSGFAFTSARSNPLVSTTRVDLNQDLVDLIYNRKLVNI